jgi:hypothetical protein
MKRSRVLAGALVGGMALFCAAMASAMASYPGGTWSDRTTPGHSFFRNFFCDLTQEIALSGAPNPGARVAQAGMLAIVLAFFPFWWLLPSSFPRWPSVGRAVKALGAASVAGLVAVPLTPSLRFGWLHSASVLLASVPALAAAIFAVFALAASRERVHATLGGATVIASALDAALYVHHLVAGGASAALPVLQKISAGLLLAWMLVVAATSLRQSGQRGAE